MIEIVPEAISYRSHSLVDSSMIISYCVEKGIKNNLNIYYFPERGTSITPYKRSAMRMIPFIFEDDLWLLEDERKEIEYYLSDEFEAFRIFNFHPIQLYLNCESYDRYERAKIYNYEPDKLEMYRNKGKWGMEYIFRELIRQAREKRYRFSMIKKIGESVK